MSAANNGGPAFPIADSQMVHSVAAAAILGITDPAERDRVYLEVRAKVAVGMTLHAYFAAKAMQAAITGHITHYGHDSNYWQPKDIASYASEVAEAMLAECAK